MKRWTEEHAANVAKRFSDSDMADSWDLFGGDIQRSLIDSLVMDEMRIADTVDSEIRMTASEIVAFRALLETALAVGTKRRRPIKIRY